MDIELTIKNYRCFSDAKYARIVIRQGFTAFLGINNSGKSSLLRFLYEFRDLFRRAASSNIVGSTNDWQRTDLVNALNGMHSGFSFPSEIADRGEVFCNLNNRDMTIQIRLLPTGQTMITPLRLDITIQRSSYAWTSKLYLNDKAIQPGNLHYKENSLYQEDVLITELSALLNACELLSNTVYIPSFRNLVNVGANTSYYDTPIGQGFISQWNSWKTGTAKREQEIAYQVQEDLAKIFEYARLEINASPDGQRLNMLINGKSYKMSELGSGFAQFFLVLASAAMRPSQPAFVLVDEPEINLHPSLQLDFLTRLTSYASHGILFATHGLGLARASADHIYSVRRGRDGQSEVTDYNTTPRLAELLGELSFAGYKELGFDKILLVEGSTEVRTIQQFLRWYKKEHQIVLVPLGNIKPEAEAQLEEIKRISDNVFALIDSERSAPDEELEEKRAAFKKLCDNFGIICHVLEKRATEHYLAEHAIKKIKGDKYRALQPYEAFKDPFPRWSKSENWQIAQAMVPEDLDNIDLGNFLKSL